jgi:hypothetical protein
MPLSNITKLRASEIQAVRLELLAKQNNFCAICSEPLDPAEAVLDHCHTTGYIRAVLHRGCNMYIGALENNQRRNRITPSRLTNILAGFESYVVNYKPILHPTHLSPEERQARARKRAKNRRKKK